MTVSSVCVFHHRLCTYCMVLCPGEPSNLCMYAVNRTLSLGDQCYYLLISLCLHKHHFSFCFDDLYLITALLLALGLS